MILRGHHEAVVISLEVEATVDAAALIALEKL
jgi:hypothetical protein